MTRAVSGLRGLATQSARARRRPVVTASGPGGGDRRGSHAEDRRKGRRDLGTRRLDTPPDQEVRRLGGASHLGHREGCTVRGRPSLDARDLLLDRLAGRRIRGGRESGLSPLEKLPSLGLPPGDLGGGTEWTRDLAGAAPPTPGVVLAIGIDVPEKGEHRVVVGLAQGIELVVVTPGTPEGDAEKRRPRGGEDVVQVVELGGQGAVRLVIPDMKTVEAGRDDRLAPLGSSRLVRPLELRGDLIPRDLLPDETVVWLVRIEGADDVVAIAPGVRLLPIPLVAVALGEADQVEPMARPAFPVMGGAEEAVDEPFPGAGGRVGLERGHLLGGGGKAGQVK